MPKKKELVKFLGFEDVIEGDLRVIRVEVCVPIEPLKMSDCCEEAEVIVPLKRCVEEGIRKGINSFIESGRDFFKSAKTKDSDTKTDIKKLKETYSFNGV